MFLHSGAEPSFAGEAATKYDNEGISLSYQKHKKEEKEAVKKLTSFF